MVLKFQLMQETEFGRDFWRMFWVSLIVHVALLAVINYSRKMWTPPVFYAPPSYSVDLVSIEEPKPQRKPRPQPKAPPKPAPVARPEPKVAPKPVPQPKPETAKEVPAKAEPEKKIAIPDVAPKEAPPEPKKAEAKAAKPAEKPAEKKPVEDKPVEKKPPDEAYNENQIRSALADVKKRVSRQRAAEERAQAARGRITSQVMQIKYKVYYNTIWSIMRENWIVPQGVRLQPGLETILSITVAVNGRVENIEVEKRSGNDAFDDSAVRAVERSSPFPPLPGEEKELEVGIRFTPEELQ